MGQQLKLWLSIISSIATLIGLLFGAWFYIENRIDSAVEDMNKEAQIRFEVWAGELNETNMFVDQLCIEASKSPDFACWSPRYTRGRSDRP